MLLYGCRGVPVFPGFPSNGGFHKWGYPKTDGLEGKIPLKMDEKCGGPLFQEPPNRVPSVKWAELMVHRILEVPLMDFFWMGTKLKPFSELEAVQPLRHLQLQREPQFRGEGRVGGRDGASSSDRIH